MSTHTGVKPTIVLVHGAFADASSWNGVIERLHQQGCGLTGCARCSPSSASAPAASYGWPWPIAVAR